MNSDEVTVNARGMKCPWPVLRAARMMRDAHAIMIEADDPRAGSELEALAQQHDWAFAIFGPDQFTLARKYQNKTS